MTYDITDFGAVPDGVTVNTRAVNRAIEECARNGGGRVVIPAGGVFVSGTVWLKSRVELYLEHGAVLRASGDLADYNGDDAYPQNTGCTAEEWTGGHFIVAHECEDVAVCGTGTIDGNAGAFVTDRDAVPEIAGKYGWFCGFLRAKRPGQCIAFVECRDVRAEGFTLRDTPSWGLFLHGCDHVHVRGLTIRNRPMMANSDGIDIDCCSYVTVSDCDIDTGDDAIAVRGSAYRLSDSGKPCEYVTITNCVLASCSDVFRIGVGRSEIRHLRVSNITAHRGHRLIDLCVEWSSVSRTPLSDISFSHIAGTGIKRPFGGDSGSGVKVEGVSFENIRCDAVAGSGFRTGVKGSFRDFSLRDVEILVRYDPEYRESDEKIRGSSVLCFDGVEDLYLERVRVRMEPEAAAQWERILDAERADLRQVGCAF